MNWMVAVYVLAWLFRVFLVRHQLRTPRFFGPDWCFDSQVGPGFYERAGRDLMRWLEIRVISPLLLDVAIGILLWWERKGLLAVAAECAITMTSYFYHTALSRGMALQVRKRAIYDVDAVSSLAASLRPRRAIDYSPAWLTWAFRIVAVAAVLLFTMTFAEPGPHRTWQEALLPGVLLYGALGLALAKKAVANWRVFGTPAVNPEQFMDVQDASRRHLVMACDYLEAIMLAVLLVLAVLEVRPELRPWRFYALLGSIVAISLPSVPLLIRSEQRLTALGRTLRAPLAQWRPAAVAPFEGRFHLEDRLCFDPDDPAAIVPGPQGMALNASSHAAWIWLAYLAGWLALAAAFAVRAG